jgi:hypothetical protein
MTAANRIPRIAAALCLLVGVGVGSVFGQLPEKPGAKPPPGLAFHTIQFHAGQGPRTPTGGGEGLAGVKYSRDFNKSSAGYISAQAVFKNLRTDDNEYDYKIVFGLYTFEGQLISARKKNMIVPPDWKYTWASQSFGWPESGKWDVGTYRVKVWLEGEKVGESAFYIHDDKAKLEPGIDELEIESLGFYEGGDFFRPGITKKPATRFARSQARRIYWVVRGKNRLHKVRAQRPNVAGYFHLPDGTLMAVAASRGVVSPEIAEVTLVEGVGWGTPGNWEPGRYRFELEQDNRVIAERNFDVTDPLTKPRTQPRVVHFGLLDAGVFQEPAEAEGGAEAEPAGRRDYKTAFDKDLAGKIWAEIVVVNNPNYTTEHRHKVAWEWIGPDGATLAKSVGDFTIQPAWKTASRRHSFGEDPKETPWAEGRYKILVSIDGRLQKVLRFVIDKPDSKPSRL